ncbi:zinc finger MYM-type protein 1-like protein [Tanacetum coccineum]
MFRLYFLQTNKYTTHERDPEKERVEKAIGNGEVETGRGKNQELSLIRAGDTRWNISLQNNYALIDLLPSVIKVLEFVENEGNDGSRQNQASEREALANVNDEDVIKRFQNMTDRKGHL